MRAQTTGVFVGRELELDELSTALEDVFAGHGRLFLISGEPGIGKSRLADELTHRANELGTEVLVGRCWEAGGAPAFWPWVQALRARVRDREAEALRAELGPGAADLAQILPELRELFPDLPDPPSGDPEGARFRLFDAVASFLRETAQQRPVVLVLDDLHAADEPSLLLLRFLARELTESRLLVVALYRDVDPTVTDPLATALAELGREPLTRTMPLSGLAEPEVASFIELAAGRPASAVLAAALHAETEGNPLFVGEIVRLLAAEGRLDESTTRIAIPQSVQEVIGRRLGQLSEECNRVLTLASVLGREFEVGALERLCGMNHDPLIELLDEAMTRRVVSELPGTDARLRFAHALIRDVIYEALPRGRRMQLHLQAGEALEDLYAVDPEPHLAELAHQFFDARDEPRAIDYARRAAERALALLAYEEAVRLYGMALELTTDRVTLCELLLGLGEAQSRAGDTSASNRSFLEAADLADAEGLARQLARAALGYGGRMTWEVSRDDERVVPLFERAIERLGETDAKLRVRLLARLAGGPLRDARFPAERRAALSEEALATARRIGDPATLAYAIDGYILGHLSPDDMHAQLELAGELVEFARAVGNRERLFHGHEMQLSVLLGLGDVRGAKQALEAMASAAGELRQPAHEWLVEVHLSLLALLEGRLAEAEKLIANAFALGQKAQSWNAAASYALQLYLLRRDQGRLAEVEELIRSSADERPTYPILRCVLANLTAELGLDSESREFFKALSSDRFAALPFDEEWLVSLAFLAETARLLRLKASAGTMYELLLPYADRVGVSYPEISTGAVSRYLGILASVGERWDEATRHFEDALELNGRMGARPWVARTQHDQARMLLDRRAPGDEDKATALLRSALATCRELGMDGLANDVSTLLSEIERSETPPVPSFADYRIEDEIGRGGMAVVYRATDLELDRPVALKLIAPELAGNARFRERFLRESRLAASLDHANVIPIYEAGEAGGQLFLAMRYVEGEDLKTLLRREGKLAPERSLAICAQVASALDAAHRRGLVHRDVKPGNVLLDEDGHAYLADFGLSKQIAEAGGATQTGQLAGTLDYLAPEQIRGEELDGRSDQYALACVLYECLAGRPPFRRATEAEALWAHMQEEAPGLEGHPALDGVLQKALAKAKESRFESAAEFIAAARSALRLDATEGVATIMFTDVAGSTALADRLGDAKARELIETQRGIVREQVATNGGRVIDSIGDGLMVAFDSSRRALACAVAIQEAVAEWGRTDTGHAVRLRIGLNVGEVLEREGHPFGAAVNAAARIAAVAEGGQILVSDAVRQLAGTTPGISFRDRGRIRLKGFTERWRLHEAVVPRAAPAKAPRPAFGRPFLPPALLRRSRLILLAGVLLVAGGIAAAAVALTRGGGGLLRVAPNSLGVIDPKTNRLVGAVSVGDTPTAVVVGGGSVWVLNSNEQTISRVVPTARTVAKTIPAGQAASDLAVAAGTLWVTGSSSTFSRIDPDSGTVVHTSKLPVSPNPLARGAPSWVAADGAAVWATGQSTLTREVPLPVLHVPISDVMCCNGIAIGDGSVWLTDSAGLSRLDARTGVREAHISLPFDTSHVAVGSGGVWLTDARGNKIWIVDPRSNQVEGTISVGDHPQGVAVGDGAVWVASADGTVSRIDPSRQKVVKRIVVGGTPAGVAVGGGAVWVTLD